MKIGIVTDSTADIPNTLLTKYNIQSVPAILILGDQQYLDGHGISREDFYKQLPTLNPPPTTAAPAPGVFKDVYEQLFKQGCDHIFSIHISQALSGIYNSAKIAASAFGEKISLIDSGQLSLGLGFQVIAAAETAVKNASVQEIMQAVLDTQKRIRSFAMLDTLSQLKKSGRVSWIRAGLGSIMQIKAFIELSEGQVLQRGQARTRNQAINHLQEILEKQGPLEKIALLHTNAKDDLDKFFDPFKNKVPEPLFINVTTVIGTHVGVNAIGFAALLKK